MKGLIKEGLKMLKSLLTSFLIIISIVSCKSQGQIKSANSDTMKLTFVLEDNYSGQDKEELITISNQNELELFMGKVNRTRKPGMHVPEVDFKKEMVVVWCGGNKNASKLELSIKKQTDQVIYLKKKKSMISNLKGAITTPFVMYKLPKTSKVVKIQ